MEQPASQVPAASVLPEQVEVVVLGAGFSGIAAAARLVEDGYTALEGERGCLVLERAEEIGGTWRDNTYPGCACDVQSHLYSLSFAPNPDWSRSFSQQPEILAYLRRTVRELGLHRRIRLGTEVQQATWEPVDAQWVVRTNRGALRARVLVAAPGGLSEPAVPDVPGRASFEAAGGLVFHSARWPADLDLAGRRVAVVGTGASAVQVVPAIAGLVEHLVLLQRTPAWVLGKPDHPISARARRLYRRAPRVQRLVRRAIQAEREAQLIGFTSPWVSRTLTRGMAERHLRAQVPDPDLRARLRPDFLPGCKRITPSNDYWSTIAGPGTELLGALQAFTTSGIRAVDGTERPVDTVVLCTGFRATEYPIADRFVGLGGRSLAATWGGSPTAHLGTTVAGFPNLFLLMGPNTGLGHSSVVLMAEAQVEHLRAALAWMRERGVAAVEPTAAAQAGFVAEVDRRLERTVWRRGGCHSWYEDDTGRLAALWPGTTTAFRRRARRFVPGDYRALDPARPAATPAAGRGAGRSVTALLRRALR